jgi:hypothetical protein
VDPRGGLLVHVAEPGGLCRGCLDVGRLAVPPRPTPRGAAQVVRATAPLVGLARRRGQLVGSYDCRDRKGWGMKHATLLQADALRHAAGIQGSVLAYSERARRECIDAGWIDGVTGDLTPEGHRAMVLFAESYGTGSRTGGSDEQFLDSPVA